MPLIILILSLFVTIIQPSTYAAPPAAEFKPATPGYHYSFPRDHGAHEAYQTEWWYYTGHLQTMDGHTYGYQLTFFRSGMDPSTTAANPSRWTLRNLYLAHFAITDENQKRFFYAEKVNRAGIRNAGAETDSYQVWNGGWVARGVPTSASSTPGGESGQEGVIVHHLVASEGNWAIDLLLTPMKPPIIHGKNGISKKGARPTQASHYYSLTRMATHGRLRINGQLLEVQGTSWMDHEFGSNQLSGDQIGWDWFGLQLDSGTELMLYQIRRKDGGFDPFSSGTLIFPNGHSKHLAVGDFQIQSDELWRSRNSGGTYPSRWQIFIPGKDIILTLVPTVQDQELITTRSTGVTYWEGSVKVMGTLNGQPTTGRGYVELTGYVGTLRKEF